MKYIANWSLDGNVGFSYLKLVSKENLKIQKETVRFFTTQSFRWPPALGVWDRSVCKAPWGVSTVVFPPTLSHLPSDSQSLPFPCGCCRTLRAFSHLTLHSGRHATASIKASSLAGVLSVSYLPSIG